MHEIRRIGERYELLDNGHQIASLEPGTHGGLLIGGHLHPDELAVFIVLAGKNAELREWLHRAWRWGVDML